MSSCSITLPKGTLPVFGGPGGSQQRHSLPRRGSGGEVTQSSVSGQLSSAIENAPHKPVFSPPHPQHNHDLIVKKTVNNYSWLFALLVAAHNDFSTTFRENSRRQTPHVNKPPNRGVLAQTSEQPFKYAVCP